MRAFAAAVLVLATLAAAPARADDLYGGAVFYVYQRGTSTTKVDRVPAQKLDLYPVTLDAEFIHEYGPVSERINGRVPSTAQGHDERAQDAMRTPLASSAARTVSHRWVFPPRTS